LRAEGKSIRTVGYYRDLLRTFPVYCQSNGLSNAKSLIATEIRQFLSWVGSRTCEYNLGNGTKRIRRAKPATAYPYFRALRRLFKWAVREGYISISPLGNVHFKSPVAPTIEGYKREGLQNLLAVYDLDMKTGAGFTGIFFIKAANVCSSFVFNASS
jgi:site-specific recombinase XerD